ncbi:DUF4349 domain-containing protein [Chloroflexota bacterium]
MKKLLIVILAALLLLSASCGEAATQAREMADDGFAPSGPPVPAPAPAPAPPAQGAAVPTAPSFDTGTDTADRRIVRTGYLQLQVENIQVSIQQITAMAANYGGFVVSSNVYTQGTRLSGAITIRVLAEHFYTVTAQLRDMAIEVISDTSNSQDVTQEYTDLTSRLSNLEATEAQLLTIMERAGTIEDVLKVQIELNRVRGDIEQTKGRILYLERTSETSLIDVVLIQSQIDVDFTASQRVVKDGENIRFMSELIGGSAPFSFTWDFGDGETSHSEVFVEHAYKSAGTYTVSLTVIDDNGNQAAKSRQDYISVEGGWSGGRTASTAWKGFVVFGRVVGNIFIWLGIFSPLWLVILGIIYWRLRRKRAAK